MVTKKKTATARTRVKPAAKTVSKPATKTVTKKVKAPPKALALKKRIQTFAAWKRDETKRRKSTKKES